ncbi:MAG: hypothetical protein J4G19_09935 [Pseudomonadales bacterium]|nr:hypothetical protein [Pseudomonadales bacterium]
MVLCGFYHIPINAVESERLLYWDKLGRPDGESAAQLEYVTGGFIRVLDSWWTDQAKAQQRTGVQN